MPDHQETAFLEKLHEFYTLTEELYDPLHVKNFQEGSAIVPLHEPQSLPQAQRDHATTSLAARDLQTVDALIFCAFQETTDIAMSKSGISSTPLASPQARDRECSETDIPDVPPEILKRHDEAQIPAKNRQAIQETKERDPDGFPKHLQIAVALTRQRIRKEAIRGRRHSEDNKASHNDTRIIKVQRSRKGRVPSTHRFHAQRENAEQLLSVYRTVEDRLRISEWRHGLQRHTLHVLKRQPSGSVAF